MNERLFGENIRDAIRAIRPQKKPRVEFPMCEHPELYPTVWGQTKPEPTQTVGECPVHNYTCPTCGHGAGCYPSCDCGALIESEKAVG